MMTKEDIDNGYQFDINSDEVIDFKSKNQFIIVPQKYDKDVVQFLEHHLQMEIKSVNNRLGFSVDLEYFILDAKKFEQKAFEFKPPESEQQWWDEAQTITEILVMASWSNLTRPLQYFCEHPKHLTVEQFKKHLTKDLDGPIVFDKDLTYDYNLENCLDRYKNGVTVTVPFEEKHIFQIDFTNFKISLKKGDKLFQVQMI